MALSSALARCADLAHLTGPQLQVLRGCASQVSLASGTTIFSVGERPESVYLVDEGRVAIQRRTPAGTCVLATLDFGELFGETCLVETKPCASEAVALGDLSLVRIHAGRLLARCRGDRDLDMAIHWVVWKSLARKLRHTNHLLDTFFTETSGGASPPRGSDAAERPAADVSLASKRHVFEEQSLSNMEIHFLASLSREERYEPDDVIFRQGDPGDELYLVLEGRVRISRSLPDGGEEALDFLERGDYFGEMALLDEDVRSADARAHEGEALVLAIPRDAVRSLLNIGRVSSIRLLKLLCRLLAKRLRRLDEKLAGWFILVGGQAAALRPRS